MKNERIKTARESIRKSIATIRQERTAGNSNSICVAMHIGQIRYHRAYINRVKKDERI